VGGGDFLVTRLLDKKESEVHLRCCLTEDDDDDDGDDDDDSGDDNRGI